jgi:hypothetical protein
MRKLAAAGAQATLSPVRKPMVGKENAEAGPSRGRRRMEPVGEEEEEPEEGEPRPKPKRTDVEDEALYQKARVVTGNGALFGRDEDREVDHREGIQQTNEGHFGPPPRRSSLHPAQPRKSVASSPPRKAMAPARMVPAPAPAPPRESKSGKQRVSLFETVAKTLSDALHMAQTPGGFYALGQSYVCVFVVQADLQMYLHDQKRRKSLLCLGWITVPSMGWDSPWQTVQFVYISTILRVSF